MPTLEVYSNNTSYGTASYSGDYGIGNTVTLIANVTSSGAFLGWRANSVDGEYVSGDPNYSFVVDANSPYIYYAIFEAATTITSDFRFNFNQPAAGQAEIYEYTGTDSDLVIPSVVYNNGTSYTVTALIDDAFANNTYIETVTLPSTLTTLGSEFYYNPPFGPTCETGLFEGCTNLRSVNFEDLTNLTSIGDCTFKDCTSLESVFLPNTLETMGSRIFINCSSLSKVTFENGFKVTSLKGTFINCTSLTQIEIPANVEELTYNNPYHTDMSPNYGTFGGCTSLSEVTFEEGSKLSMLFGTFSYCSNLETLTLPESLSSIGGYQLLPAFGGCSNLKSLYILASVPPSLTYSEVNFVGISEDLIIYVPQGSLTAYQTATGWSDIADHIQEMS